MEKPQQYNDREPSATFIVGLSSQSRKNRLGKNNCFIFTSPVVYVFNYVSRATKTQAATLIKEIYLQLDYSH